MSSPIKDAFEEGFDELAQESGDPLWYFGAASFIGISSALKTDDPRLAGGPDRMIEIMVKSASLPSPAPTRGNVITKDGKRYTVIREPMEDPTTGYTPILVSIP
jgi:hypothetical protein